MVNAMAFHERTVGSPVASESGLGAERDLQRELARGFATADLHAGVLDATLRQAIRRFVDEAKARGASADAVVSAMKDVARRAGFERPDAARPLASMPADRLLTRAITACIETFHEADDGHPVPRKAVAQRRDPQLDTGALRALLSRNDEEEFTLAIMRQVRSARARGAKVEHVLEDVIRVLNSSDDTMRRLPGDAVPRSHQLVILGLLLAVYGEGTTDAAVSRPAILPMSLPREVSTLRP
jgi:hypothetical protein